MDTVTLVENQIESGQRLLDRLDEQGGEVRTACWLKRIDEDRWSLYIATPSVDKKGQLEAYHQLTPLLLALEDNWLTSSDVTLVGAKDPLVRDALDLRRRLPHKAPIRPPRGSLGEIPVEAVYVYPLGKTKVPIYHLVFPDTQEPGILSLRPLEGHFSIEVEHRGERKVYQGKTGLLCVVAAPEGARVERDQSGTTVLAWDLHGNRKQSSANEVWSLANLGLHGFRFLPEPAVANTQKKTS